MIIVNQKIKGEHGPVFKFLPQRPLVTWQSPLPAYPPPLPIACFFLPTPSCAPLTWHNYALLMRRQKRENNQMRKQKPSFTQVRRTRQQDHVPCSFPAASGMLALSWLADVANARSLPRGTFCRVYLATASNSSKQKTHFFYWPRKKCSRFTFLVYAFSVLNSRNQT